MLTSTTHLEAINRRFGAAPGAGAVTRAVASARALVWAHPLLLLLGAIGAAGALVAATGRGPFFDEAIYLMAGRLLVFRGENWHFETWFVGSPFAFPVAAGLVQAVGGGIVALRLMNVAFLLLAVWSVYRLSLGLGLARDAALLGAASFGFAGPVLFTGSFATYDMPALALTLVAFQLAVTGTAGRRAGPRRLALGGLAFGAAVIVKYVVIAVSPALALFVFVRLVPLEPAGGHGLRHLIGAFRRGAGWIAAAGAVALVGAAAALPVGLYLQHFWWELRLVFSYAGGHTTDYGASAPAVLAAVLLYVGPAWLLASAGLERLRGERQTFLAVLVLVGGSLIMPVYHLWKVDPLALFKQMSWSLALLAPAAGAALAGLRPRRQAYAAVLAALGLLSLYHVTTLRAFYPDSRPAEAWLRTHVTAESDPILADDVWPYRLALADTFEGREWWTVDQWWWRNTLATPELWQEFIRQGRFAYVVFERGGAFNGAGSVFDAGVIDAVEHSGRYERVAIFPSRVTWGNSILPPPFTGQLRAYNDVDVEIWARVPDRTTDTVMNSTVERMEAP